MNDNRRPVKSRSNQAFHQLASKLVGFGLTPNQISVFSSVFAAIAAVAFLLAGQGRLPIVNLIIALVGIQGRLVCNLIDGLMAVESGLKTKTGELFNEVPDRVSDTLIFMGAAYSVADANVHMIGWLASLLAIATAYIRVLGASMGTKHFFSGPMAKQHRMFLMNLAIIGTMIEIYLQSYGKSIEVVL